jgi:homoserine kinase type II
VAVYTHLGADQFAALVAEYDVGELVSVKGIAEGVSNSNWLVETTGSDGALNASDEPQTRFILTMYERRIDLDDLPFFLGLLDHLSAKDGPVPRTIHDRTGNVSRTLDGKAIALRTRPKHRPTRSARLWPEFTSPRLILMAPEKMTFAP